MAGSEGTVASIPEFRWTRLSSDGVELAAAPDPDLFGTIVHELRGPLTVIRGQVQFARRQVGRDSVRELDAIDTAIAQVDRMGELITELLDHARLCSDGIRLNVGAMDLGDALDAAVRVHEYGAIPRIRFERPARDVRVRADPARLAQILDNLLSNALKYSAVDAPIEVSLTVRVHEAQVEIADHGVGIPPAERPRLFTPFFRASTARNVSGTGLGLNISRRLAELQGGRLWLGASSEAGSVFALVLPLVELNGAAVLVKPPSPQPRAAGC